MRDVYDIYLLAIQMLRVGGGLLRVSDVDE